MGGDVNLLFQIDLKATRTADTLVMQKQTGEFAQTMLFRKAKMQKYFAGRHDLLPAVERNA